MTKIHLHLNGLALLICGVVLYGRLGYNWILFAALILAPDIFMLGYLVNTSVGAYIYNIGHSLIGPMVMIGIGLANTASLLIAIGIIWACHIGLDHVFGYGYKYRDSFKHTHFSEV